MEHGYDVTFLSDAIGSDNPASYEAAVHLSYPLIANAVLEVDEFRAAVDSGTGIRVEPGDRVVGSDHGEIGEVKEVVEPASETAGYLFVARGRVFKRDTYIPFDAVVKKVGSTVFVNVPKLIVAKMPWDAPPSAADQQAKRGASAPDTKHLYGSRGPTGSSESPGS